MCGALLTGVGMLFGLSLPVAFVAAIGLRADVHRHRDAAAGRARRDRDAARPAVVSILLLEDLAIVPLLADRGADRAGACRTAGESLGSVVLLALVAVASVIVAGRWLLNPLFRRAGRGARRAR